MQRNSCEKQYPAVKKISLMTYNAEKKKYYTRYMSEKTFLTPVVPEKKILPQLNHPYQEPIKWSLHLH